MWTATGLIFSSTKKVLVGFVTSIHSDFSMPFPYQFLANLNVTPRKGLFHFVYISELNLTTGSAKYWPTRNVMSEYEFKEVIQYRK